jgi:hypothetical protein
VGHVLDSTSFSQPLIWVICLVVRDRLINQPLHPWNVKRVSDMNCMFDSAVSFNQPLDT